MKKFITALLVCFMVLPIVSKVHDYSVNTGEAITIEESDCTVLTDSDSNDDDKTQTI